MHAHLTPAPARSLTVSDDPAEQLAAAFLLGYNDPTRSAYAGDLRAWGRHLAAADVEVMAARRVHVDAFVRDMEAAGLARSTMARRLSAIGKFYKYAVDEGVLNRNPCDGVNRPKVSDQSVRLGLDAAELAALQRAAIADGPRAAALVALLGALGLRVSEALAIDVEHLGQRRGHRTVHLAARKGGKVDTAPVPDNVGAAVDALADGRTTGPLFHTKNGKRMDRRAAHRTIARLARAAGIDREVSPHDLRHAFVTLALDAGVPLHRVQDAAGHADPRTTRRYDRARGKLDGHAAYAVAAAFGM